MKTIKMNRTALLTISGAALIAGVFAESIYLMAAAFLFFLIMFFYNLAATWKTNKSPLQSMQKGRFLIFLDVLGIGIIVIVLTLAALVYIGR